MSKRIILIGGAPTVGKSFTAKKLSEELNIPWISTDTIREFMRGLVNEKDYPNLFYFTKQDPNEYLKNKNAQQIVDDQNRESVDVWRGVKTFIETNYNWDFYIIEGVAILPDLVKSGCFDNKIKPIFILDNDIKRIKRVVYGRGLWTDPKKYSDDLKGKEIEWVVAFNNWLGDEIGKYRYPTIEYVDGKLNLSDIKKYLR